MRPRPRVPATHLALPEAFVLVLRHLHTPQPLDAARADDARYDCAQRVPVVAGKLFSVHLVRKHRLPRWVARQLYGHGGTIGGARHVRVQTLKVDVGASG